MRPPSSTYFWMEEGDRIDLTEHTNKMIYLTIQGKDPFAPNVNIWMTEKQVREIQGLFSTFRTKEESIREGIEYEIRAKHGEVAFGGC